MKHPMPPPKMEELLIDENKRDATVRILELVLRGEDKEADGNYLHWDKLRYKLLPDGINDHEEWWLFLKFKRKSMFKTLPFEAISGQKFKYCTPDFLYQLLSEVDKKASGKVEISEQVSNPSTRDRYLISSLMEEAITSSQLEGASTTHKVAKEMLREKRKPRNKSEQMIFNNYRAMSFIRELKDEQLSKELILELHKIVTEDTLEDKSAAGRFRTSSDEVAVYHEANNLLLHTPPPAEELDARIDVLCEFANQVEKKGEFLHPVIRSIMLHFMIGYDHPFVDGNGRTARALFYWSMVKHGYWMTEYISISKILKNGPTKYAMAYLYTESDEFDMTYFVDFNLRVILRAIDSLHEYLARKADEVKSVESNINNSELCKSLNYRQLALLSHAIRNPGAIYTIETHGNSHNISYPTSRTDLLGLVKLGIVEKYKRGKAFVFRAVDNLKEHLSTLE